MLGSAGVSELRDDEVGGVERRVDAGGDPEVEIRVRRHPDLRGRSALSEDAAAAGDHAVRERVAPEPKTMPLWPLKVPERL